LFLAPTPIGSQAEVSPHRDPPSIQVPILPLSRASSCLSSSPSLGFFTRTAHRLTR